MLLLIDNYDSFTYNVLHYLGELGSEVEVVRNDAITVDKILNMPLKGIVISPGPCDPDTAGICLELVERAHKQFPMLGICLGHQTIGQAFGGKVIRASVPMHGKISPVIHQQEGIFSNIPSPYNNTRYHSLILEESSLPSCLKITARTEDGTIMGIQHKEYPLHGVQFHPESIASDHGHTLLKNFLAETQK